MANQYYDGHGGRGGGRGGSDTMDAGKIFVGGLSRDTGDDELRNYFAKYGPVVEAMVKKDPYTGHSRGFGFVKFKDSSSVDRVLSEPSHTLQNKVIDPKRAQTRGAIEVCRKIFVGGLDPNLPEDSIREYFGQYGTIDLVEQPFDREKNIKKGFCFITFESGDPVDVICSSPKHHVGGRDVDVKKATPKEKMAAAANRGGGRGGGNAPGGGGRGRGRGDGYPGGWEGQPNYAMPPGYPAPYDYSAYYGQQGAPTPAYGAYGQAPPTAYPMPDPYAAYAAAAAAAAPAPAVPSSGYDYSAWYGAQPGAPPQQNGGGPMYGGGRGGQKPADSRYQPY